MRHCIMLEAVLLTVQQRRQPLNQKAKHRAEALAELPQLAALGEAPGGAGPPCGSPCGLEGHPVT